MSANDASRLGGICSLDIMATELLWDQKMHAKTASVVSSILLVGSGCSESESQRVRCLSDSLFDVATMSDAHLEHLPQDEHFAMFQHEYNSSMHKVLKDFQESDSTAPVEVRKAAQELDDVVAKLLQLHQEMMDGKRFSYTETEEAAAHELQESAAVLLGRLLEICEEHGN